MQKEKIGWKFNERRYNVSSMIETREKKPTTTGQTNTHVSRNRWTAIVHENDMWMARVWMCKCDWIWEMARLKLLANDVGLYELYVENRSFVWSVGRESITFDSQAMDTGKMSKDKLSSSSAHTLLNEIANP